MDRTYPLVPTLACAIALVLAGCGKDSSTSSSSSGGGKSSTSSPDVTTVRADLKSEWAEAKEHADAKHFDKIHEPAAHIWALAAKLRAAKAPYGRLFRLARDLDAQGDAGNSGGVAEVMTALEKEIANPSSPDVPDDGAPLVAEEHEHR